ncbi:MAG TPA: translation initiation factor IF-1 [Candidatus Portnoybacteria bacterium]|nr:translation initiation factor IF-1 [Candidatus Portnoybacteria bacterium]
MVKQSRDLVRGEIIKVLPNTNFRVSLENEKEATVHLAGRLRLYRIRIVLGDKVLVELSPYDTTKGRIVRRI